MPWNNDADSSKHNKKATGAAGAKWRSVANAILRETGDDAKAVRIANSALAKHLAPRKRFGGKKKSS